MIAAFAIVATIIAIVCGVLIYAVGNISQRAEREAEESYQQLLRQKETEQVMERMTRL
jgi:type II secretory pathway pseudopilin PulG